MTKEQYLENKKKLDEEIDKLMEEWLENPSWKLFKEIRTLIRENNFLISLHLRRDL